MTRRLATTALGIVLLIALKSLCANSQDGDSRRFTLKGIDAVSVAVEPLPSSARALNLSAENIQTDVELKLRLAGIRVVTKEERVKISGGPFIYVLVNITDDVKAANVRVLLAQDAVLERNFEFAPGLPTWEESVLVTNPNAQVVRNEVKDLLDMFLNAWLSVNPKK